MGSRLQENKPKFLAKAEVERIVDRIIGFARGGGETEISIRSWWAGSLTWARNRASLASDRRDVQVSVGRMIGQGGMASTNQIDDVSLEAVVRAAERVALLQGKNSDVHGEELPLMGPVLPEPVTRIWSDTTADVTAEQRGELARSFIDGAETQGMMSAGWLNMFTAERAIFFSGNGATLDGWKRGDVYYHPFTLALGSITVRHPKSVGSGWAGLSGYDWGQIDGAQLAQRALDKCIASMNPVAIEPGRYTTILEPQAVWQLLYYLRYGFHMRSQAQERASETFYLGPDPSLQLGRAKLGLKVADERVTICHTPTDPAQGILPRPGLGSTTWIERGVLKSLGYNRGEALTMLHENDSNGYRTAMRMEGGPTTMTEMIETTKRGILLTHFSDPVHFFGDTRTLLCTGITRDGLWLIENGKISKSIKNMRFVDSPLYVLNQIDQIGPSVPIKAWIYGEGEVDNYGPCIVPPLKVNDFAFTAMFDAV